MNQQGLEESEGMLSKASKVDAILDAWLEYIQLDDFSNAKIPSDQAECNRARLIDNNLLIDEKVFAKFQDLQAQRKQWKQETTWAVSFPQIYRVEDNKSFLCPLFSLDITSIFQGSYQAQGWNIEELDMAEAGNNLAIFLNLDEEQLKQLVTKDGLRRFLETTFDMGFESLEDWMRQINLQDYRLIKRPYLFEFKGSGFSFNLKKDLNEIKKNLNEKRNDQDKHWLQSGYPAHEYLFGIPKPPPGETLYWGAFLTHPPTDSQLEVLKHAQSAPVTAVQGPPGSGKTTLILHLIAQQVVNRALSLIETGTDINNLTVVSSTNNRAVDEVLKRLSEELTKSGKELPNEFFYLSGGSKTAIDRAGGAKEQLQGAIDFLQNSRESNFDEAQYESLKLKIKQIKNNLIEQELQYQEKRKQRQVDEARLPKAQREICELQQDLVEGNAKKRQLEQQLAKLAPLEHLPETIHKQIQKQFNLAQRELPEKMPHWSIHWIYRLLGRTEKQILARTRRRCKALIAQTEGTRFQIEQPFDRFTLSRQSERINKGLELFHRLRVSQFELKQYSQSTIEISRRLKERQREAQEISDRLAVPLIDFYSTFHRKYHKNHQTLFNLSRQFLIQEALRQKNVVKDALETYLKVLSDGTKRTKPINPDNLCKSLSLLFPVMACTLLSVRNMLPWIKECVDRVIVDESGMIPLHQTFPLLVRSRKAIVVGDPLQIEPIVNQTQQTLDSYLQESFINSNYSALKH